MSKTVTLRLSDDDYNKISSAAKHERRPISNFITHMITRELLESYYADPIEMAQIKSDERLQQKLKAGHSDAKKMKGRLVG